MVFLGNMKAIVLLSVCLLLAVEGVSLKKSTPVRKFPFQPKPLAVSKESRLPNGIFQRSLEHGRSSRQMGSPYQPVLSGVASSDPELFYDWSEPGKVFIFGEEEVAGMSPYGSQNIIKWDAFEEYEDQPGVYILAIGFYTEEGEDIIGYNIADIDSLVISTGYIYEGEPLTLPLGISNGEILEVGIEFYTDKVSGLHSAAEGVAQLNVDGSGLVSCQAGGSGVMEGVNGAVLYIFIRDPAAANTEATGETFPTGDGSGFTESDFTTATIENSDLTEDTTEETKQTQQTTDETEETQETSESQATCASQATSEPSGSQPDTTVSGSNTEEDTDTAPTEATKFQSQTEAPGTTGTTGTTGAPATSQDNTSSAVSLCVSFFVVVGALVQLL